MCSIVRTIENKLILDNNLTLTQHNGEIDIPKDCMDFTEVVKSSPVVKVFQILINMGVGKTVFTAEEVKLINKWMEV